MSLRQRIFRTTARKTEQSASRSPLPEGMAECTICGARETRDYLGNLPDYWFTFATRPEVRCPTCLAPVLADVDRAWAASNARFLARERGRGDWR